MLFLPDSFTDWGAFTYQSLGTLNDSNDKTAWIVRAPKSGTLHSFEWRNGATATLNATLRFSFQGVNASGEPDGSPTHFVTTTSAPGAQAWIAPPGPLTDDGTAGGNKKVVTQGDLFAIVLDTTAYTSGGLNAVGLTAGDDVAGFPYQTHFETSWAKLGNTSPVFALKYADGTYGSIPMVYPYSLLNTHTYNNTSTPDEIALVITPAFDIDVAGVRLKINVSAAADLVLYDANDGVLTSLSLVSASAQQVAAARYPAYFFPATIRLLAGQTYRLAVLPTSGSNITFHSFSVADAAILASLFGGGSAYYAERTNGGAWSPTTTQRPFIDLWVTAINSIGVGSSQGGFGGSRLRVGH